MALPCLCRAMIVDGVAAKIDEDIITISDVKKKALEIARMKGISSPAKIKKLETDVLTRMIDDKLFLIRAGELGITAEEKDVDSALEDLKRKNGVNDDQFREMLERNGITREKYRNDMKERIIISKVTSMEIRSQIKATDKDIKKYYREHQDEFAKPEEVKASHILISFKKGVSKEDAGKKAREIYAKLKKGEKFETLARLYSDDATAADGGNLGYFTRGMMVSEFEDAAFTLKVGEVGAPIMTRFGYHIIKVTDKKPQRPIPLEKARSKVEDKLIERQWNKKFDEVMTGLKSKHYVEILIGLPQGTEPPGIHKGKSEQGRLSKKIDERNIAELIKKVILKWRRANEKKDIKGYSACYSSKFHSGKQDKRQWIKRQRELFKEHKHIRVAIRGLRITRKSSVYVATFGQEFLSASDHMLFERRFYLRLEGDKIKILREKSLARKPDFKKFSRKAQLTSRTKVDIIN